MKKKKFNFNGYVFGALRKIWRWDPERKKAIARAFNGKNWTCEQCSITGERNRFHCDHVVPVVDPKKGFRGFDIYIKRLRVKADKLQILCKKCHKKKTAAENKLRRRHEKT